MTPEQAVCQLLAGEKLGSIRSIRYLTDSQSATKDILGALEIETKTGRLVHCAPAHGDTCVIAPGPVPAPDSGPTTRYWTDLTDTLRFAFDGRPTVSSVHALRKGKQTCGCAIEFSGGGRLIYQVAQGAAEIACKGVGTHA
jgi:hypothetical protein